MRSKTSKKNGRGGGLTHDEVVALVGDLEDDAIAEIIATGATTRDLDEAIAWAESESDAMGELERHMGEPATTVYRILMTRKERDRDRRSSRAPRRGPAVSVSPRRTGR